MGGPNFFRFNGVDWGIAVTAIVAIGTAFLGLVHLVVDNRLNTIKVDFARLEENVGNKVDGLNTAFQNQSEEVGRIVQAGLNARTDEIKRALIAASDEQQWFYVQVANVPQGSETFDALKALSSNFGSPTMMMFGDKAAFDFYVTKLNDEKAEQLQSILTGTMETGVETAISISSPPGDVGNGFTPEIGK